MLRSVSVATLAIACSASVAQADFMGWASFIRTADNGHKVVDIVATFGSPVDRAAQVFDARISGTFIQDSTISGGGFAPDSTHNTRSSTTDSFLTIGVNGGAASGGEYYASSRTQEGAGWGLRGWDDASATVNSEYNGIEIPVGWQTQSTAYSDSWPESLSNFTGTRVDSSFSDQAQYGVWVAHLVFDPTVTTSVIFDAWIAGYSGGGFQNYHGPFNALGSTPAVPGVGGIAAIAGLGLAGRRRRR
jgi:hypothetical protein